MDDESIEVLHDVAHKVAELSGVDASEFQFLPVALGGDIMTGQAVRQDDAKGLLQVFQVAIHDTPGLDNGLLLVTPLSPRELDLSSQVIRKNMRTTQGLNLGHPEQGWQRAESGGH